MNILLINPPLHHLVVTELPESISESRGCIPPLGLLYIASYVKRHSLHNVSVLDTQVENLSYDEIGKRIAKQKPDLIGIQALTCSLVDVLKIAKTTKEISKEIITVVGGPHLLLYPDDTLNFPYVDYVIIGEGERNFTELVNRIADRGSNLEIEGVGYKYNGNTSINRNPDVIFDLDDLPFPDRTMVPYQRYYSILSKKRPITTMITSRGCPYHCAFCHESESTFRAISPQVVIDEMQECLKLGIKEIFIHDDTFTVNRKRVIQICEEILRRGLTFSWEVRGRVDTVDKDLLFLMKKAGCDRISYGVESGSQKVLDKLEKGILVEQIYRAFSYTREAGIPTLADFMFGSPDEGEYEIRQSIELMRKIVPDYVHISITTPYPGTKLYQMAKKKGLIVDDSWKQFAQNPSDNFIPPIWEEKLNRNEIVRWVNSAYRTHYLNPRFVFKNIFNITSSKDLSNKLKAFLKLLKLKRKNNFRVCR